MAGAGPPPKPPGTKVSRKKERVTVLPPAPADAVTVPDMPPFHRRGGRWHPRTVAWWRSIGAWPQAATFLPSDWDHLADTAIIKDALFRNPDEATKYLPELRIRMASLGATVADRLRLRMTLGDPPKDKPLAEVSAIDARREERKRLGGSA